MTSGSASSVAHPGDLRPLEIIKGRLYFVSCKGSLKDTSTTHYFNTDQLLCYEPFYSDFGPLNIGHVYRFCKAVRTKLKSTKHKGKQIVYYCGTKAQYRANSAALIGAFQAIYLDRSAEESYAPLRVYEPYIPFRDASTGLCSYKLSVLHAIQGIRKAFKYKFFDFEAFNVEEYEYFECVENGDLNTMVPGKFIAFAGPHSQRQGPDGYPQLMPCDYFPIWNKYKVKTIVRLNRKMYDKDDFVKAGYRHYDLFFIDGTTPSPEILHSFIKIAEEEDGMIAVHCKAGLGRTGTLIACYMMKHYKFNADEAIAWLRIARPGSVIGPQQQYIIAHEEQMWKEGEMWRKERGLKLEPFPDDLHPDHEIKVISSQLVENLDLSTSNKPVARTRMEAKGAQIRSATPPGSAFASQARLAANEPKSPTQKQKQDRKKRADSKACTAGRPDSPTSSGSNENRRTASKKLAF